MLLYWTNQLYILASAWSWRPRTVFFIEFFFIENKIVIEVKLRITVHACSKLPGTTFMSFIVLLDTPQSFESSEMVLIYFPLALIEYWVSIYNWNGKEMPSIFLKTTLRVTQRTSTLVTGRTPAISRFLCFQSQTFFWTSPCYFPRNSRQALDCRVPSIFENCSSCQLVCER